MAWIEARKTKLGNHFYIYYRINGSKPKPVSGGYNRQHAELVLSNVRQLERQNRLDAVEAMVEMAIKKICPHCHRSI